MRILCSGGAMIPRCWTISGIECWKRGCICEGCQYHHFFESLKNCRQKVAVIKCVKKFGPPPNYPEKTIIE